MTLQLPSILKHKGIVILLLLSIIATYKPVFGQVYPVQANINIIPPYTIYLHQYTSADQQKLIVNILLHDPVVTSVDVRFRFTIEGGGVRIYTNPGWIPQPFNILNGISSQIPGNIIAEYFQPQHLIVEGINPQEFYRSGRLPEGFYQFKVEVMEYQRGSIISNTGLAGVWLLLNESPRIVFPTPNQKVKATNPQMLNFSWVPGGISSPLSALNTMYEFTMVEIPDQMDPTIAITTASDAIKFTRTLQQTSLFYGPGEPQLIPGKKYAVRVRAFNTDGLEIFKNNGYSEVRVFQFGETCNSPISFDLNDETQSTFNIEVQTDPSNTAWLANFRESESSDWSELKAEGASSEKTVRGLKASTTYEVQLKGLCGPFASDFTFSKTITTMERTNTERICENTTSPFVVTNALPLPQLKKDHIFLAALVPIKVSQVTKQGGGKFSGNGIATLPFFNAGLAVTFDDIQINELMQLTSGEVNVVRNAFNPMFFGDELPPTDGTSGGSNPDSTGNGTWPPFTDTITINVPFDSIIVVNDSTIWVIPSGGGEAIVVDLGGSTCTLILPPDGNLDNAKVVYNGAARPYNSSNSNDGSLELFTGFLANFDPSPTQAYGFDSLKFSGFADYYNEMDVNGKVFKMPWKALAPNSYEPVNLKIRRSSDSFPYSDLKVGIWGGDDLVPVAGSSTALQTYNLKGTNEGDEFAVVAKFNSDDKEVHAGGIWAVTYQPKSFNLYIVALEGSNIDEECARMQNEITTIYKQALVNWSVKPLYGFKGIDLGDNGLDWTDSEFLSAYNTEMNSVISAFKDWHPNSDPDAYYLFVVPKFSDNTVEGFMPRNRRFGFISAEQLYSRNVAHELGHGAFNLRHTFPEVQQYSTDNLMDYPPNGGQAAQDKYALLKAQWDLIHNPESTTGLFDEMEDGASKKRNGTISIWIGDSIITDKKIFINSDKTKRLYAKFVPDNNDTLSTINLNVYYKVDGKKNSTVTNWTLKVNQKMLIGLDSLPEASYKLTFKDVDTLTFFLRKKKYDFACSACGRDLTMSLERFTDLFPLVNKNKNEYVQAFNIALKANGYNSCDRQAKIFAQIKVETNNLRSTTEGEGKIWRLTGDNQLLDYFKKTANAKKRWFNQEFWDTKMYKNFCMIGFYEKIENEPIETNLRYSPTDTIEYFGYYQEKKQSQYYIQIPSLFVNDTSGLYKSYSAPSASERIQIEKNIFNYAYGNSMGNGDYLATNDGFNYRGRGAIQLTGKGSYISLNYKLKAAPYNVTDVDILVDPDAISDKPELFIYSAFIHFNDQLKTDIKKLDSLSIDKVSALINTGDENGTANHAENRRKIYYNLTKTIFKCK